MITDPDKKAYAQVIQARELLMAAAEHFQKRQPSNRGLQDARIESAISALLRASNSAGRGMRFMRDAIPDIYIVG